MQGQFGIPRLTNGHEREVNGGLNFVNRVWANYDARLFKRPFGKAPSDYEAIFSLFEGGRIAEERTFYISLRDNRHPAIPPVSVPQA